MLKNAPLLGPPELTWGQALESGVLLFFEYLRTLQLKPKRGPTAAVCLISEAVGWILHSLCDSEQWNFSLWSPILFMEPLFLCLINHCHFEFLQCLTKSTYVDLSIGLKLLQWRSRAVLSTEIGIVPHRISSNKPEQWKWGQLQLYQVPPWLMLPQTPPQTPTVGALSAEIRGLKLKFWPCQTGA